MPVPLHLLAAVLLALIVLLSYQLRLSYREQLREAETSTRNLAAMLQTRTEATLRRADADLAALVLEIPPEAMDRKMAPAYQAQMNARLNSRLINIERTDGFHVIAADGEALYSSDRIPAHPMNLADRDYFRRLRDDPQSGLVFSGVVVSRVSGRDMLVLARGLRDGEGNFTGMIIHPLDLEYYRRHFHALDLGKQGVIALRHSGSHELVVSWPAPRESTKPALSPHHPAWRGVPATVDDMTIQYTEPDDGARRIMSVKAMNRYPFYFAVGVGRDEVLAGWYSQVRVVGISLLLVLAVVGGLLWRLGRMRVREAGILSELAQSELEFAELAKAVPVGISHFDSAGRCTYVNDYCFALTGRSRRELLRSDWLDFVHPDDRGKLAAAWKGSGRPGFAFACEYRLVRPGGTLVHVFGEARQRTGTDGRVLGYLAALTDISQRKQAEADLLVAKQQAENASLAKTRFLAAASHDLRQPIQAINLFGDTLLRTELSEEQKSLARNLSISIRLLGDLLYSLLDISRLEAGLVTPRIQALPADELLKLIDAGFSPQALLKKLRFKLFYPFPAPVLSTDSVLLLSVLRNLVDNAFKYTEKGGVLVSVRKRGGRALIQVWDTGIGIDPGFRDLVFEECFQIGNSLRDRTKGLGIGLSIARRTARLLGCDVTYRSRPGRGSVFEISVPLAEAAAATSLLTIPARQLAGPRLMAGDSSRLAGWRVVVIEDDRAVAASLGFSLQSLGITVTVFHDAETALSSVASLGADFYVSDFSLPGRNGLECLKTIQRRWGAPIDAVLITAETPPGPIEFATGSPWPVLSKPVELDRLIDLMNRAAIPDFVIAPGEPLADREHRTERSAAPNAR